MEYNDYQKMMSALSDKEKIDLAARLTQAAMSAIDYQHDDTMRNKTQATLSAYAAEQAYIVFGTILRKLDDAPERFPDWQKTR